jgi:hypothetical protein
MVCHELSYYILYRDKKLFEGKESRDSLNKNPEAGGIPKKKKKPSMAVYLHFITADFLPET